MVSEFVAQSKLPFCLNTSSHTILSALSTVKIYIS
uniref:Uncharacterized protein n=1 Tax=Anguilla anguilla TaxID=7936 RepID=A0A0E9UHT9_ANGAN